MRTCLLESKSDRSPPTLARLQGVAHSRLSIRTVQDASAMMKKNCRGSPESDDESEEGSEVEVENQVVAKSARPSGSLYPDLNALDASERKQAGWTTQGWIPLVLGVLIVAAGVVLYAYGTVPHEVDEAWLRENLTRHIRTVRDVFPSQAKTIWPDLYSGIRKVLLEKPTEPSVFLLLHEGTESTSSCLARKVGRVALDFLEASAPAPLVLDGASLQGEDSGLLVDTYRLPMERHRIMIVHNLQLVPATVARGLHAFCDTVTPLVRKAVYIFTLDVGGVARGGGPTATAERGLYAAWGRLNMDVLAPLVVRVTGGAVFRVEPEESIGNKC